MIRSWIIFFLKEFVDYLKVDNVVLLGQFFVMRDLDEEIESDFEEWQVLDEDLNEYMIIVFEFNEIDFGIKEVIIELDGVVFFKLNWSFFLDVFWIFYDGILKCKCLSDIYFLFKSFDNICRIFFEIFKYCEDGEGLLESGFEFVFCKWKDINLGMEFWCFVKDYKLIVIFQRDIVSCYEFIE